jgi:hypothetical protein
MIVDFRDNRIARANGIINQQSSISNAFSAPPCLRGELLFWIETRPVTESRNRAHILPEIALLQFRSS